METTPATTRIGAWYKGDDYVQTAIGPFPAHPQGSRPPVTEAVVARAMVLALVVAGFTVVGGGQALASHVGCGDTITTDTTLDSDLVNCPNNGIIIGADNITLDLNGHTIDGDGTPVDPCPEGEPCDVGVLNLAGHDRLTIVGGTIRSSASASSSRRCRASSPAPAGGLGQHRLRHHRGGVHRHRDREDLDVR